MFRPNTAYMAYNPMPPHRHLVDMAYKHPQLLVDDEDEVDGEGVEVDSRSQKYNNHSNSRTNDCKLIGNVTPSLVKTWEQLNGFRSSENILPMANYPTYDTDDGNRSQDGTTSPNRSFIIRRAAAASGHYYDSIDNESFISPDDDEQLIASICEQMNAGGEALAEYISIIDEDL